MKFQLLIRIKIELLKLTVELTKFALGKEISLLNPDDKTKELNATKKTLQSVFGICRELIFDTYHQVPNAQIAPSPKSGE
jgi:hypothetical protein